MKIETITFETVLKSGIKAREVAIKFTKFLIKEISDLQKTDYKITVISNTVNLTIFNKEAEDSLREAFEDFEL